jgi:ribose transport system permease protein
MAVESALSAAAKSRQKYLGEIGQEQIILLITVLLLIAFVMLDGFPTLKNLLNPVRSVWILGILGLGMRLIVISSSIDLGKISIMAAAWSIPLNQVDAGMPIGRAVSLSIFIAVLIGAANGVIIAFVEARPSRQISDHREAWALSD